jgi:hypothetical protein
MTPLFNSSPFEILFKQSPYYQFLHTLGCECFPLLRPYNQQKLQPRSESCIFMGYSPLHKGIGTFTFLLKGYISLDMFSSMKILFLLPKSPLHLLNPYQLLSQLH